MDRITDLKAWAYWKRIEIKNVKASRDVSKDELFESESGFLEGIEHVLERLEAAEAVCKLAILYDDAIRACANDPKKMSSFCTAQGDNLDAIYLDWITKARSYVKKMDGGGQDA